MSKRFPDRLDPWRFADLGKEISGKMPLEAFARLSDCLLKPVFFWYFKVCHRPWLKTTDLYHANDKVRSLDRLCSVQACLNRRMDPEFRNNLTRHDFSNLQSAGINIHQGNQRVGQCVELQNVSNQFFSKNH